MSEQGMALLGVPSSLAAHWSGQEKAPQALRAAGIVNRLHSAGVAVTDGGDLPVRRFRPDPEHRHAQSLDAVVMHLREVSDRITDLCRGARFPLVIGGECTTTIAVMAGMLRNDDDLALLYIDGGYDLHTPATNPEGILDSMGVAHMLADSGTEPLLARIGRRVPLLQPHQVVFFGQDEGESDDHERRARDRLGMVSFPASVVRGRETDAAHDALERLRQLAGRFLIHFDVDVIDFMDCPIADVPQFNTGLTLASVMAALRVFVADPRCTGLVLTEFNPDHADPDGADTNRFIDHLVSVLGTRTVP